MSTPFGDLFGTDPADALRRMSAKTPPKNESALPQIRGKEIDGVLYVRAADMADALAVLSPTVNKRLIDKLRGYGKRT